MKRKTKCGPFTSRPEPPTLLQIAEDIFNAQDDDCVFKCSKGNLYQSINSLTTGLDHSPLGIESEFCINQIGDYVQKMKRLKDIDYLRERSEELKKLRSELDESCSLEGKDKDSNEEMKHDFEQDILEVNMEVI